MPDNFLFKVFRSIVVFDVETSGLDSRFETIIEFGGLSVMQ